MVFADLAVANSSSNNVIILLGKGDGTFSSIGSPVTVGSFPRAIAMGDFNGDGIADLAVGNELNNNVSILLNQVTQTATATLTGVSVPGVVSHLVNATYPGDTIFGGSTSSTIPLTGSPVATQTTLVLSTAETIVFGTPVTMAATVTPTTAGSVTISGSVQFLDGTTVLGSAPITAAGGTTLLVNGSPIPNFAAGTHMLTAVYVGNTSFNSSTSPVVNLTVSATQIEVSLVSSTNPSSYGQAVTFTAAVPSGATGAIQFQNNGVALGGPVEISGTTAMFTTSALTAGTHAITAVYSGDNNHNPATSGTLEQEVLPAQLTVTATNATRVFGQPNPAFAYTITGFVLGDTQSVVTGTLTLETTAVEFSPVGAYPIAVDHGTLAASNYTFALVNGTLVITKATPGTGGTSAVTVSSAPNPSICGQNVTFTATVPPNATGMV
jgi:hypothetical protein